MYSASASLSRRRAFYSPPSYRRILHDRPINGHLLHKRRRIRGHAAAYHHLTLKKKKHCRHVSRDSHPSERLSSSMTPPRRAVANNVTLSLPRVLIRPPTLPIQSEALREACPELDNVSENFIRKHLTAMAPNMLAGVETTRIIPDNVSELPTELPVVFDDTLLLATVAPTHILALSTPVRPEKSTKLFLIHQLPFAANCSSFPALPTSSSATPAGSRSPTASLPVIRASVPSIDAFPLFQTYLYVKDPEALRVAFLPTGWSDSIKSIMERAFLIKGFWSNAFAFGMLDDEMFNVVDDCWAEVLQMLNRR